MKVQYCREWPYPEKVSKQKRPFGQYKAPKGHKYEKEKQQRCVLQHVQQQIGLPVHPVVVVYWWWHPPVLEKSDY